MVAYKDIFRGLKFEHNPGGIGFAFHGAGVEIGQNSHLWIGASYFSMAALPKTALPPRSSKLLWKKRLTWIPQCGI
jgi:hypothetical protein